MNNNQDTNCVALTVRREQRLVIVHKVVNKSIQIFSKAIFATLLLTFLNMVI